MSIDELKAAVDHAVALKRRGEYDAADAAFAACLAREDLAGDAQQHARAALHLADLRYPRGALDEASVLAERARALAAEAGLVDLAGRASNVLGIIAMQRQDWAQAGVQFQQALECAYEVRDDALVGAVCMNLGTIKSIEGDLRDARSYYLESIGSGVRLPERAPLVMAYNNLGMVCTDLEEWMEALIYFARGIEIAAEGATDSLLAILHVNQAEPLIEIGETDRALESLEMAERHAHRGQNELALADCGRFRGRIARLQGDWEEADRHLRKALEKAGGDHFALNRAELLEEQALLLLDRGDPQPARQRLLMARSEYSRIGARRDAARVENMLSTDAAPDPPGTG